MKKELFIKAQPNNLQTFDWLMNEGHKAIERGECDDFQVQINFRQDCVKLYLINK